MSHSLLPSLRAGLQGTGSEPVHPTTDTMDIDPPRTEANVMEKASKGPSSLNGFPHNTTQLPLAAPRLHRPQFPTSRDAILARVKRQKDTQLSHAPPYLPIWFSVTYEDVLREQKASRNKAPCAPMPSTLSMPEGTLPPLRPPTPSLKRKRTPEADDSPLTIGPTAAAALAADRPARIVPKPLLRNKRTEEDGPRRCDKCESAEESPENLLVVCPVCDWSWHQRCHDPEIGAGSVRDRVSFKCADCVREGAAIDAYRLDKLHQDQISSRGVADVEKLRNARLAELPAFNKPELVGFKAGDADRETRRAYFSSLRKTDVINLLLFSDAVKDGLLIDVLVSMSNKHPNLPLFNHPDWAVALTTPASLPRLAPPKVRQPAKPVTKRPKTSAIRKVQETETIADQPDEEPLPGIWPEAGIGLYSKLPPELPDPILLGQNDEEAFSGFMIDRNGRPVEPAFG
ncbi:hypothetical protein BN1723_002926 [Verticillium longisporum]|uniref:PHD-type domain-containing protein n=1 Tax=Verticillium longisporum TaxID=100787 RepID=A0A0G4LLC6_VERLO|nr:hypothetical protein BN1708_012029 [Verticillium longisporum]CRK22500.1 hypothetical protein BN1723_002926 [Verticillium longisporum]